MLTDRFEQALIMAHRLHRTQTRKNSGTPYLAHLLSVAALVLEDGGTEDEAIAALLHDAVEDQGGQATLTTIRQAFGDTVAEIVLACSDTDIEPKPPWRARKEAHLAHLQHASPAVLRVTLADKLHNARSLLSALTTHGTETWQSFKGGKSGTLWYFRAIHEILATHLNSPLLTELEQTINAIEQTPNG